jgi:feruloyl esterase
MLSACSSPQRSGPAAGIATVTEGPTCSIEAMPELPDVELTSVTEVSAPVPRCRVLGVIGTETNFELLLPDDWNGRFVMGGGGGFVGSVVNTAMAFGPLQKGYATVGTDTGHRGSALDASWALNELERVVSFGHQAVHRTAVTAKALIADYYGQDISRSLFLGCSRGGGQALMEAQRYPDDFDGIVAGAPAYNWTEELGGRNTSPRLRRRPGLSSATPSWRTATGSTGSKTAFSTTPWHATSTSPSSRVGPGSQARAWLPPSWRPPGEPTRA